MGSVAPLCFCEGLGAVRFRSQVAGVLQRARAVQEVAVGAVPGPVGTQRGAAGLTAVAAGGGYLWPPAEPLTCSTQSILGATVHLLQPTSDREVTWPRPLVV